MADTEHVPPHTHDLADIDWPDLAAEPAAVTPDTTKPAFPGSAADKARPVPGSQVARTIAAMRPRSGRS